MKNIYWSFVAFILSFMVLTGQPVPDSLWVQGNMLVADEKYDQAATIYEQILGQGYEHELLYYNLGIAYFRSDKTGMAIWAYEKGLQFNPRHADLNFNLNVVKTGIKDRIDVPQGFILIDLYRAFKNSLTLNGMLLFASFLLALAGALYTLKKIVFSDNKSITGIYALFIIGSIIFHLVFVDKYLELSDKQEGIIIKSVTDVHSTPSGLGKTLFRVHEGLKVEITQVHNDWLEIILLDGKKGWVYSGGVRLL